MMLAEKIFSLDSRKTEHFRNLIERQSLLAVGLKTNSLEGSTGHITTSSGKPLGNLVGDVQGNFHVLSLPREG